MKFWLYIKIKMPSLCVHVNKNPPLPPFLISKAVHDERLCFLCAVVYHSGLSAQAAAADRLWEEASQESDWTSTNSNNNNSSTYYQTPSHEDRTVPQGNDSL